MNNEIVLDIINVILKSIVSISVLYILTRIMGKKQISQLTYFDYVSRITIGSIAAMLAVDKNIAYYDGITCMIVLTIFPLFLSFLTLKSIRIRKFLDGNPTILVQNGKIIENNLKKTKLTVNDLLEELRVNKAFDITDVEFAILETSGKLSVQLKSIKQSVTPTDLNINTTYKGLCANLIIDGRILKDNLELINKDYKWLINELHKHDINSPNEVLLATVDNNNTLYIDMKNCDPTIQNVL
ncbi:MAG: DUF421 domain-containing protein [Candidatus Gastranaerophilales bacterium]|nr:DUF421 domain-containing protein [Candidatus Gastranaerophilales bacterium]